MVALAVLARGETLVGPALDVHTYDGHEAEYWDLFRGMRAPTRRDCDDPGDAVAVVDAGARRLHSPSCPWFSRAPWAWPRSGW